MIIKKLISGGQIGADRAALEAAYDLGIRTGGWIPKGFLTSSGKDPILGSKFNLIELNTNTTNVSAMYIQRSMKNVDDADATIAFRLQPSNGTDKTIAYCYTKKWKTIDNFDGLPLYRPCLVITNFDDEQVNIENIRAFIIKHNVNILNIAGHKDEVIEEFSLKVKLLLMKALK